MVFEKTKQGLGFKEIEFNGEKAKVSAKVGDITDYKSQMLDIESKGNKKDVINVMTNFCVKLIKNANPEEDEKELKLMLETNEELLETILIAYGLYDKQKARESNKKN